MPNNSINSDWETARRFALRRFPAGYAERYMLAGNMVKKWKQST
jgi:hypothetical protein